MRLADANTSHVICITYRLLYCPRLSENTLYMAPDNFLPSVTVEWMMGQLDVRRSRVTVKVPWSLRPRSNICKLASNLQNSTSLGIHVWDLFVPEWEVVNSILPVPHTVL